MKLTELQFDGPNNGCQSLRFLAELVRIGDVRVAVSTQDGQGLRINVWNKDGKPNLALGGD